MDTRNPASLDLRGGRLCLDFVNTVDWRDDPVNSDYLNSVQDLIAWGRHAGLLTAVHAQELQHNTAGKADRNAGVFAQAIALREVLYRIFYASIQQIDPLAKDLAWFNARLATAMASSYLTKTAGGFGWDLGGAKTELTWILKSLVRSAADLLVSADLPRLKQCVNPKCDWFFLDNSRNRSRNWCNMKACGNRAKARRFYQRRQKPLRNSAD